MAHCCCCGCCCCPPPCAGRGCCCCGGDAYEGAELVHDPKPPELPQLPIAPGVDDGPDPEDAEFHCTAEGAPPPPKLPAPSTANAFPLPEWLANPPPPAPPPEADKLPQPDIKKNNKNVLEHKILVKNVSK